MGAQQYEKDPQLQAGLNIYFDRVALAVRSAFQHIETNYITPLVISSKRVFKAYPISACALAIFAILGFLPIAAFVGFTVFTFATFIFIALAAALISSLAVVGVGGVVLVATLSLTLAMTLLLTWLGIGLYLVVRLLTVVRSQESIRTGVVEWGSEVKQEILSRVPRRVGGSNKTTLRDTRAPHDESTRSDESSMGVWHFDPDSTIEHGGIKTEE